MFKRKKENKMNRLACQRQFPQYALGAAALILISCPLAQAQFHKNPNAEKDMKTVANRGDVKFLPGPLKHQLVEMARRPHTFLPMQVYAEADDPSMLFQYFLLDTHAFQPNVFTAIIPGVNDTAMRTAANAANGLMTVGSVRLVVEPKPGLPTDPNDIRAFIDIFTDISGLFVINNESGWYEGWMLHDITVPDIAAPRNDGHAQFGKLTVADAQMLALMGTNNNIPGNTFTIDGNPVRFPRDDDHFPDRQTNVVPLQLSMGAYNAMQQSDVHAYWEFNYTTNWIHPTYELPFTGGLPGTYQAGLQYNFLSLIAGPGPNGPQNDKLVYGDTPDRPRDPDLFDATDDAQREFRERFIPSGLANEIYLDAYERLASFEPNVSDFQHRLFDAYVAEVRRVDQNGDSVISALEGDVDSASDGFEDNTRLFLPPTGFNRFAVTREINDGILAPRLAPSQRAWVLTGRIVRVDPPVPASEGRDGDDR